MASQVTGGSIVCSTVRAGTDQRKHESSVSLAFVKGIHRWLVASHKKGPVKRKMFSFWWCHHEFRWYRLCDESYAMWNRTSCFVLLLMASFGTSPGVTLRTVYTKLPLMGYRCVMDDPSELLTFANTARPQCVWRCLSLRNCMVVSHNGADDTCELAIQRCDRIEAHPDFSINVYGKARSNCVHWISVTSYDQQKAVIFPQGGNDTSKIAVSRIVQNTGVYPGKVIDIEPPRIRFLSVVAVSANEYALSRTGQVLHLSPTCQPAWMPFSTTNNHEISEAGSVVGGRIANNEDVYVARARFGYIYSIGYYRPTTGLGYFVIGGKVNATSDYLEILALV